MSEQTREATFRCAMPDAVPPRSVCKVQCEHCRLSDPSRIVGQPSSRDVILDALEDSRRIPYEARRAEFIARRLEDAGLLSCSEPAQ